MKTLKSNATQLIVIDSRVTDWQSLISGNTANATLLVLDPLRDGLTQIAEAVANSTNIDAIHIISHGNTGSLLLGATTLNNSNLIDYQAQLSTIGNALSTNGDILLYGCDVAQGNVGQQFIEQLSSLTGADIAASTDLTGNANKGGNWVLEAQTGAIEATSVITEAAQTAYQGTLVTNPTGVFNATDSRGAELWVTDGTAAGTHLVDNINTAVNTDGNSNPQRFTAFGNNKVLFTATDGINGYELWITDGTKGGTYLVKDIWKGSSGNPQDFVVLGNGLALFSADNIDNINVRLSAHNLWVTDGTSGGTSLLNINVTTAGGSGAYSITSLGNGKALLGADDGINGTELWITDGTTAGTHLVANINAGANSSNPNNITSLGNGIALFSADDGTGQQWWVTNGTVGGTISLGVAFDPNSPFITSLGNGTALFNGTDSTNGTELWITDGTTAGTHLVANINAGANSSNPNNITSLGNGIALFSADDGSGQALWVTNGTLLGTINIGSGATSPSNITSLGNGTALFSATDSTNGTELWITDGTTAGTHLVKDIYLGGTGSNPSYITSLGNGTALFSANSLDINNNPLGTELWITDGTDAGTHLVSDINQGVASSSPSIITLIDPTITTQPDLFINENITNLTIDTSSINPYSPDPSIYSLVGSGTDNNLFTIDTNGQLQFISSPNYEVKNRYNITVHITDKIGGAYTDKSLVIGINNVNEAPTDLAISKSNINENVAINNVDNIVGTLSSTDPDVPLTPNTFTYSFVTTDPAASVDNSAFTIVGDKLEINSSPNFEAKSSYNIEVRTTDQGGLFFDKPLTITINNVNESLIFSNPAITVNYTDTPVVDDFINQTGTHETGFLVGTPDANMASIPLTYGIASTVGVTVTDNLNGTVSGSNTYGTLTVTKATGAYSFVPNNSAIEPLGAPATSSLTVTVTDGLLNASQTFTVAIAQSGITETNGNDSLTGTTGNDTINGLAGADTMAGGLGNDTYYVDNLGDVVVENTNAGNDIIYSSVSYTLPANVEALVLLTGAGNINGYANSQNIGNSLTGNDGNNILVGGAGNDVINGLAGNDTLDGGVSDVYNPGVIDSLKGSAGDDTFLVRGFFGAGVYDGGTGIDAIDFSQPDAYTAGLRAGGVGVNVNLATNKASTYYLSASNYTWADPNGQITVSNIENVIGTNQNDLLYGDNNVNSLDGGAGNDVLYGAGGLDVLKGGAGNDTYYIGYGDDHTNKVFDTIIEDVGDAAGKNDLVYAFLTGYTLADNVETLQLMGDAVNGTGNAGNNTLIGNTLSNSLDGGAGNDTLDGGVSDTYNPGIIDTLNGGAGDDTFLVRGFFGAGVYDGGTGINTIDFSQNDAYTAGIRNNNHTGVKVDLAANVSSGIAYTYYNAASNYTWTDTNGQISLTNIENVTGSSQSDFINGDGNANILDGGVSDVYNPGVIDKLNGGAGNDTFLVSGFFGAGVYDGGTGIDTLDFSQSDAYTAGRRGAEGSGVNVDLSTGKASTYYLSASNSTWADSNGQISVTNIENVIGTNQNDLLYGDNNVNSLDGGAGNDVLYGAGGLDVLKGGAGNDTYYIGYGDDHTNKVFDTIIEDVGDAAGKNDLVYAFLTGYTLADNVETLQLMGDAVNGTGNAGNNTLIGNTLSNSLDGGAGNDTLDGGVSDTYNPGIIDTLNGGAGDDTFLVRGFFGAGVYDGGTGINTIDFSQNDAYTAGVRNNNHTGVKVDLAANVSSGIAYTYYNAASNYTWTDTNGQISLTNIENVTGSSQSDFINGDGNANILDGGVSDVYNPGVIDKLNGGAGNDTFLVSGFFGAGVYDGGTGIDTLDFSQSDAYTAGRRSAEGSGVNVDLSTGKASTYYLSASNSTWTDPNGQISVTNIENVIGTNQADILLGDNNDNLLQGGAGNDILYGLGGADTLVGGTGKDIYNLTEIYPASDRVVIATGDSLVTSYDLVNGFGLGTGASTVGVDKLDLDSTNIAADGITNGTNVGTIASHSITNGIISFDDIDSYTTPLTITSAQLPDVLNYLQTNITGGNTVAFIADGNTFVFQDGGATDTLVELVGVNATSLDNTNGLAANSVWIF